MTKYAMQWLRKRLPSSPCRVLDLGCGDGAFVNYLAERLYDSYGVDLQVKESDRLFRMEARAFLGRNIEQFDAIVCWDFLEHLPIQDLSWTLERIHKTLKQGGKLILRTPNAEGLFGSRLMFSDITHQWAFTRQLLSTLLKQAGFQRWRFYDDPIPIHGIVSLCRWLIWHTLAFMFHVLFAAETGDVRSIMTSNLIVVAEEEESP